MKTVLVTGANGFIGRAVCRSLEGRFRVIAFARRRGAHYLKADKVIYGSIVDIQKLAQIFRQFSPDIVIHCAGIAHQSLLNPVDKKEYLQVNSAGTELLAIESAQTNSNIHFIFLSSVSVYGEGHRGVLKETDPCFPSSNYAKSKFDAEIRLKKMYKQKKIPKVDVLRLAPVYDKHWTLNLDKRVFAPANAFYLKWGTGEQKISILSRQNLVDFINFLVQNEEHNGRSFNVINVRDKHSVTFLEIINIFKMSAVQPDSAVIKLPLPLLKIMKNVAGFVFRNKRKWVDACYAKLTGDLVFDNNRMLSTGFNPEHTLPSVFVGNREN